MQNNKKIELTVFDWAGTVTDYGGVAPLIVFNETLSGYGVKLTKQEINKPMGMEKKDHIRALLQTEKANGQWRERYGREWTEEDVNQIYLKFESTLFSIVADYSIVIPGVAETVEALKKQGIHIGSTTGYTSEMMKNVLPKAKQGGYEPECVVTPDLVGSGRPAPFMIYENMRKFGVYPPKHVVKVGDTVMDVLEGVNAGAWSVGVLEGSNQVGLSREEAQALPAEEMKDLKLNAAKAYLAAGADFVIDSITQLPSIIEIINSRL